jgi:hypothetical protein
MSSDAIEGEPSHLEAIPILSPSMPTLDVSTEPISKPILDPDDPSYALKSHNDPRIPLKHSKQRKTEKSNDNGWRIHMPLKGLIRPKPYG